MEEDARDPRRRFNSTERVALYLAAGGHCERCGTELEPGWHGDHGRPWAGGGPTDVTNGWALCPPCNRIKGAKLAEWTGAELREWQREALNAYLSRNQKDFLAVATPGAGKTTFALRVAHELLVAGEVARIVVVVPTEHLKVQWANSAHACGIALDPSTKNADGLENHSDYQGAALTYAQVASTPHLHRLGCGRRRTLVILDEIHHAGEEKAWGSAIESAFESAQRRLTMSGTPFRSDNNKIPFVTYGADGKSRADFTYGYGRAIRDQVCRQVDFHFYDGEMKWMGSDSVTSSANLSAELQKSDRSAALETALEPNTGWMRKLLVHADDALKDLRAEVPNAGGLVIAYRGAQARAYADMLKDITGEMPTVVLSEDGPEANARIEAYSKSRNRWLVAVRMVSEGVDVPRLAVGVYATQTKTEMFFRQAVGRFVRRKPDEEHPALIFAPAISPLRIMAAQVEKEIQHELNLEQEEFDKNSDENTEGQQVLELFARIPIAASDPKFDRAIHGGEEYTPEENEYAHRMLQQYGFPTTALSSMRRMVREQLGVPQAKVTIERPAPAAAAPGTPAFRLKKIRRDELSRLSRRIGIVTGMQHAIVQGKINENMGVRTRAAANIKQLDAGVAFALRWLKEIT
ncbi:DEAD/DEAH box helicase family protein [Saccharothrix sp.]|uniref:DEAD/DEAH box helicase family protein n=1 Tax=Saccharothrix sp. TaxID=1873460 RepID=UPI00281155BF|nr:DEAD/DEAH box helicase family protein [Saccharothrix sp.]